MTQSSDSTASQTRHRTVLLRHVLSDGSWHFDWMTDPGSGAGPLADDDRVLITYRTRDDPIASEAFDAQRLPDHRARYLWYEGPISGNRGVVQRVWRGESTISGDLVIVRIAHAMPARLVRQYRGGDVWRFLRKPPPISPEHGACR